MKAMRSTKAIQKLNLHSNLSYDVTDLGFYKFGLSLKTLSTLQDLSLDFYQYYLNKFSTEGLFHLCYGLKRLHFLKKFFLKFGRCKRSKNVGFYILGETFKRFTSLKTFDMRIDLPSERLCTTFCGMKKNKTVPIFGKSFRKHEDPNYMVKSLKNCHHLQNIEMSFSGNRGIDEKGLSQALQKLTALRRVYFFFKSWNMTDNGLLCLSEGLGKLAFLKSLMLDFSQCPDLTNEGVAKAKEALKKLLLKTKILITKRM